MEKGDSNLSLPKKKCKIQNLHKRVMEQGARRSSTLRKSRLKSHNLQERVMEQGDCSSPQPKGKRKSHNLQERVVKQGDCSLSLPKRKSKSHNLQERRRRDNINNKIKDLRELVPGCKKIDNASVLEETSKYLKKLQDEVNKLQMLSFESNMRMGMNMPIMGPYPAFVPGSTSQNPANAAAPLQTVAYMNCQYLYFYPTGYLQAENKATLQPLNNPGN